MDTINQIQILPNNIQFSQNDSKNTILEKIKPYSNYVSSKIDNDSFMENIVNSINQTIDDVGSTVTCHEGINNMYQFCFVNHDAKDEINLEENLSKKENDKKSVEKNNVAKILGFDSQEIYGAIILFGFGINKNSEDPENSIYKISSSFEDVADMIYSRFNHIGIKLGKDKKISEFTYKDENIDSEIANYLGKKIKDCVVVELGIFNFYLRIFFDDKCEKDNINKLATRLSGTNKIYSDVIILSYVRNDTNVERAKKLYFEDLHNSTINSILKMSKGNLSKRNEKLNEDFNNFLEKNKNKYIFLYQKLKNYRIRCDGCDSQMDKDSLLFCSGCCRCIYHSIECQRVDWSKHKIECLDDK